ncbi:MAG: hypothetical protein IE910_00170 [Brevundimonas sp.]|nr:hypothetical protein [Brevundimonas sp.]
MSEPEMDQHSPPASGPQEFAGPLYKVLSPTDAKEADTHITGVALTMILAPYFPAPAPPYPSQTTVRVEIFTEDGRGPVHFHTGEATIQVQDRRKGRIETYMSGINNLRSRSSGQDIMLFEPSLSQRGLYRVTLVSRGSPRHDSLTVLAKGRAGLLPGGKRPPRYATAQEAGAPEGPRNGMLRALGADGEFIKADFGVSGTWPEFEITFSSGDGHGRNSEYTAGVERVLENCANLGGRLMSSRISSALLETGDASVTVNGAFQPDGFELPLDLAGRTDFRALRLALGRKGARVHSKPSGSGNTTRRMTLSIGFPAPAITAAELGKLLQGSAGEPGVRLQLLDSLAEIDTAWARWIEALGMGSRPLNGRKRWLLSETLMYRVSPSGKRAGATDIELGVRPSGKPWTVEINAPRAPDDEMGLASVARSRDGRLFLIRQGLLGANSDSAGRINQEQFRTLSGLTPFAVSGGNAKSPRDWYVVAALDAPATDIRAQTGDFVQACARARARSRGASDIITPAQPSFASPETGGVATRKAIPARPATEIVLAHGEVSLKLASLLEPAGMQLLKDRHEIGYAVDGTILAPGGPILLEIKTGTTAADVYEGVGQLMLYAQMLRLPVHKKVLLIPSVPSQPLVDAVTACGITLHSYRLTVKGSSALVEFTDDFLGLFGLSLPPP